MSEKRFSDLNDLQAIIEELEQEIVEQQATIRKLQDLCGKSDGENMKLRIENKRLCDEIKLLKPTNIEQYEQIQKLQEENEQLRENLHNCRLNKNIISEKLKLWQDVHKEYNIYSIKDFEELLNGLKKENEKLRKELGDCEKFRYTTFKRMRDVLDE